MKMKISPRGGVRKWLQWSNRLIYNNRGEMQEILSIGMDMTEQKKLEEQLRQASENGGCGPAGRGYCP
ncbi:hypothetical protein ES705_21753 [subsurface metagenome]